MKKLLIIAAFALLPVLAAPGVVAAAVTKDASGTVTFRHDTGSVSSITQAYTVSSGSNFLLVRLMHWRSPGTQASSVTYNGVPLTLIGVSAHANTEDKAEMWMLVNPPVGTANVVVNWPVSLVEFSGAIDAWAGVNTSAPIGTFAPAQGTGGTPTVNVTAAVGDLVVDVVQSFTNNALTAGAGQTADAVLNENRAINSLGTSRETAAGTTVTMSWSSVSDPDPQQWSIGAVALKPMPILPDQEGFRFRADDGNETAATWLAPQDANILRNANLATRLRVILDSAVNPDSTQYQLEYRRATDAFYNKVTTLPGAGAVAYVNAGTRTNSTGATSAAPALPGSRVNGNLIFAAVGSKNNATHSCTSNCTGWVKYDQRNSGANWTVSLWYRVVDGAEAAPTISWAGSVANFAQQWQMSGADRNKPFGASNFNSGSGTTHSVNAVTTTRPGSRVIYIGAAAANTALGLPDTWTENLDNGSGTGATVNQVGGKNIAAAGTSSGNISVTGANAAWVMWQIEVAPASDIILTDSANISAGGTTDTTAQLSPPSGKTSGANFQAGKISDDTNPLPAIDLGANNYTEIEWSIIATSTAATGDVFQFRVTGNGIPFATHSVTPQWMIGTGAAPNPGSIKSRLKIDFGRLKIMNGKIIIK